MQKNEEKRSRTMINLMTLNDDKRPRIDTTKTVDLVTILDLDFTFHFIHNVNWDDGYVFLHSNS